MANPKLSVDINANVEGFSKGMKDAVNTTVDSVNKINASLRNIDSQILQSTGQLNYFKTKLKQATNPEDVRKFQSEIDTLNKKISELGKQKTDISLEKPLNETASASTKATDALTKTINTVKSVSNNSSSLTDIISGLSEVFLGGATAVAVASAAYAIYLEYQKQNESATDRNIRLTQEFNKEIANGNAQAKSEIAILQSYVSVAKDENVSREGRLQAIKAINNIMPDYLGDIKLDGINSEETAKKIDKYTQAVFLNAKVKAASSLIEKEYTKQFEAQAASADENVNVFQRVLSAVGAFGVGLTSSVNGIKAGKDASEAYQASLKRFGNINVDKKIKESNISIEFFNKILNESNKELANLGLLFEDKADKLSGKKLKSLSEILSELSIKIKQNNFEFKEGFDSRYKNVEAYTEAIKDLIKNGYGEESKAVQDLINKQKELRKSTLGVSGLNELAPSVGGAVKANSEVVTEAKVKFDNKGLDLGLTEWQKKLQQFNDSASSIVSSGISDAFGALGEGIGAALASSGNIIENLGAGLLSVIGNIATSLGKAAIGIGVGMLAIKAAFKNPLSAIAAGVALVALGSFISNKVSNITSGNDAQSKQSSVNPVRGFATGVQNFKGGLAMVGERGAELVNLPTGSSVIPNDRTNRILSNNSKNNNVQIFGEVGFNMEQFVIRFRNAEKRLERSGA